MSSAGSVPLLGDSNNVTDTGGNGCTEWVINLAGSLCGQGSNDVGETGNTVQTETPNVDVEAGATDETPTNTDNVGETSSTEELPLSDLPQGHTVPPPQTEQVPPPQIQQAPHDGCLMKFLKYVAQTVTWLGGITADDGGDGGNNVDDNFSIGGDGGNDVDDNFSIALRNHSLARRRHRRTVLDLLGISDNSNSTAIGIVAVLLGFLASVNTFVQGYRANLPFAWICFGLSVFGTLVACLLAYASIPPIVRSLNEVSDDDRQLRRQLVSLSRDAAAELVNQPGRLNTFTGRMAPLLAERILPSRLIQRKILIFLIFCFAVASSWCLIFSRYYQAADHEAPPALGP